MKITILVEDTTEDSKFESEHGLSMYFEVDGKRFLFDLGQSDAYLKNANKLDIDLNNINFLVFSHGHYDHTGGISFFDFNNNPNLDIIAHPDSIFPKYDGERYIGAPKEINKLEIKFKEKLTKLTDNVYFLGQIPCIRKKSLGEYVKKGVKEDDFLLDDSAIVVVEEDKLIVLSGCAHSGIVNIVKYAKQLFNSKEIIVIGGLHMLHYSSIEIEEVLSELKKLNVVAVFPGHCTGKIAIEKLLGEFKGERICSGKVIKV